LYTAWPDLTDLLAEWRMAIERALSWNWGPGFEVRQNEGGTTVLLSLNHQIQSGVSTSIIASAPDVDTLGTGTARIRPRLGATLRDAEEVEVFNNFAVDVPSGTRVVLGWDGEGWVLIGADCPPEDEPEL
jgi:hypothetical protein